uniref:Uncharacterized protein n=1 Tax=Pristionchus pacificus TaxID=54126 RepID=A0A2A6CGT6_PRIPA
SLLLISSSLLSSSHSQPSVPSTIVATERVSTHKSVSSLPSFLLLGRIPGRIPITVPSSFLATERRDDLSIPRDLSEGKMKRRRIYPLNYHSPRPLHSPCSLASQ